MTDCFYEPPATIDRTGTRDVVAELEDWLADVPDKATVRFPAGATYLCEAAPFRVRRRVGLELAGLRIAAGEARDDRKGHVLIESSAAIHLRDCHITGPHPNPGVNGEYVKPLEAQHGFHVLGSAFVALDHCSSFNTYGDALYIGQDKDRNPSQVVRVSGCWLGSTGRQGVAIADARDVILEHNVIGDTRRSTFDLEPAGEWWSVRDVKIRRNVVGAGRLNFVSVTGAVSDVEISDNHAPHRDLVARIRKNDKYGWRPNAVNLERNRSDTVCDSGFGAVMWGSACDRLTIVDNHQDGDPRKKLAFARLQSVKNWTVEGNTGAGITREVWEW